MVSVRVQRYKVSHPVGLVGRFHFYDGAVLLYFLKILIHLIAEDKGRTTSDRPLMNLMGAQMHARIPMTDSGVRAELKVLFKPENLFIIPERVVEITHLEDRAYPSRFHCVGECPNA